MNQSSALRWDFVKINNGGLFPEDQKNKVNALRKVWFFFKKEQFFSEAIRLPRIILIIQDSNPLNTINVFNGYLTTVFYSLYCESQYISLWLWF